MAGAAAKWTDCQTWSRAAAVTQTAKTWHLLIGQTPSEMLSCPPASTGENLTIEMIQRTFCRVIRSPGLFRAKFTNLKQNDEQNRLRRISRSLSNLQQELNEELNAACVSQQQKELNNTSTSALSQRALLDIPDYPKFDSKTDYKNNLLKQMHDETRGHEVAKESSQGHRRSMSQTATSKQNCCFCNCHESNSRKRNTSVRFFLKKILVVLI